MQFIVSCNIFGFDKVTPISHRQFVVGVKNRVEYAYKCIYINVAGYLDIALAFKYILEIKLFAYRGIYTYIYIYKSLYKQLNYIEVFVINRSQNIFRYDTLFLQRIQHFNKRKVWWP